MTEDQRFLAIGLYINSALYLTGCFVASLAQHGNGWRYALASAGCCYATYAVQIVMESRRGVSAMLVCISIALGITAGVSVCFGG